jgi:anti-anti-sigma factor
MDEGRVFYADHDHVHVLRYVGDIRHPLAPSISRFVDTLLEHFGNDDIVFDLSGVESIDSTNLGEMARIAVVLAERNGKRASIVGARSDVSEVLHSMAFEEVFDISAESNGDDDGEPIPSIAASRELSLQVILDAHRRLMAMNEGNRRQFSDVVQLMERELGVAGAERSS